METGVDGGQSRVSEWRYLSCTRDILFLNAGDAKVSDLDNEHSWHWHWRMNIVHKTLSDLRCDGPNHLLTKADQRGCREADHHVWQLSISVNWHATK